MEYIKKYKNKGDEISPKISSQPRFRFKIKKSQSYRWDRINGLEDKE